MSDLSKVLGDLYESAEATPSTTPASSFQATVPSWADDDRLDQAFAQWTPGPPPEAPAAEREMSQLAASAPVVVPASHLDDDLASTLSAALVEAGAQGDYLPAPAAPPAYVPEPEVALGEAVASVVARPRWQRADDDVLPGGGKTRDVKLPKVKAAKAAKAPKAPKAEKADAPAGEREPLKVFGISLRRK